MEGGGSSSSESQFPETHRLVTTLKAEFVAGATVQGKVDEAAQAIKDEITAKVQAEVSQCKRTKKDLIMIGRQGLILESFGI